MKLLVFMRLIQTFRFKKKKMCRIFGRKFGRPIAKASMHGIVKSKNLLKQVPVKFRQKKRLVDQIKREFQDEVLNV